MLIICNGMPRSASTYLYQLVNRLVRSNGHDPELIESSLPPRLQGRFAPHNTTDWAALQSHIPDDSIYVIKTHAPVSDTLRELLRSTDTRLFYTIRDPRDLTVALLDAGEISRETGKQPDFAGIHSVADAVAKLRVHARWAVEWIQEEDCEVIGFDQLTSSPRSTVVDLATSLDLRFEEGLLRGLLEQPSSHSNQFNVGGSGRYKSRISAEESRRIESEFAALLAAVESHRAQDRATEISEKDK